MFIETVNHRIRLVRPRSFAGLMTLYESNHVRLKQLLGDLCHLPANLVSTSATDFSVYIALDARSRYTTSLHMTYRLENDGCFRLDPDLLLHVYHDARLVEAASCCDRPSHNIFKGLMPGAVAEMERRWQLNILLHKWLEYCLDHRHVFA